jgi:hypothetical protein
MCCVYLPRSAIVADEPKPASPMAIADLPNAFRSAQAPVVFFDDVETFGHYNGIVHLTLKVALPESQQNFPQVTAAYLRMNILAFRQLQSAVEKLDLMLKRDGQG